MVDNFIALLLLLHLSLSCNFTIFYRRDLLDLSKNNTQIKESKVQGILLSGVTEVTVFERTSCPHSCVHTDKLWVNCAMMLHRSCLITSHLVFTSKSCIRNGSHILKLYTSNPKMVKHVLVNVNNVPFSVSFRNVGLVSLFRGNTNLCLRLIKLIWLHRLESKGFST